MEKMKISDIPRKEGQIQIPMWLINDETGEFKILSSAAKILYALLLDKALLIQENNWIDENQNLYILYSVEEMIDDIGVRGPLNNAKGEISRVLQKLEKVDLIEVVKQKKGKPKKIYLKNLEF